MAIGQGGNDPNGTYSGGAEVPANRRGDRQMPAPGFGQTWDQYWRGQGGGPGGSPTDFLKNIAPPDPAGNLITGDGISPGSFMPGGGTTGGGYTGTMAYGFDEATGIPRYLSNAPGSNNLPLSFTRPNMWGTPPFASSGPGGGPGMVTPSGAPNILAMGSGGGYGGDVGYLEGLDFTKRGALEQYQQDMGGYFKQPTLSEQFARNALAQGAGPGMSNRAEEAYQQFASSTPANMNPYYDNQRRIAEENIRKTMAARGSYGSSAADDLYNEAYTNLAADQAKAEAQYGLSRAGLAGSLAQGADQSSLAGSSDRRNWMNALSGVAGAGDQAGLSRVIAGGNLAGAAQGAQTIRGQNAFNNQLAMGDRMSNIMGQDYGNMFGTDLGLLRDVVGMNTGTATEGFNQASQNALQQRQNVSNFNNLLGGNMQLAQGAYNLFNRPSSPPPSPMPQPQGYVGPSSYDNYGTTNWYYPSNP